MSSNSGQGLKFLMDYLPVLIPIAILQLVLMITALVHLLKRNKVRCGNVVIWLLVIILVNLIGPVLYFLFGREEE
jgi:hypothetical protein